jgi:cytosine/adenosine deaminase-related metal-dependent hydrolase
MLIVGNGRLITRDPSRGYFESGAVVCEGGSVLEAGDWAALKAKYPDGEFLDAKGGLIMPGLINAHTHIYSGLARGLSVKGYNPTSFREVLDGMWWNIDRRLELETTRASAYCTVVDCLKMGVTTIFTTATTARLPEPFASGRTRELGIRSASVMRSATGRRGDVPGPSGKRFRRWRRHWTANGKSHVRGHALSRSPRTLEGMAAAFRPQRYHFLGSEAWTTSTTA